MSTKFLIKVGGSAHLAHVPGPPEQTVSNLFASVCKCGFKGKSCSNPSSAYQATQAHANEANAQEGSPAGSGGEWVPTAPATAPSPSRTPSGPAAGRPCECGCGGITGGGQFLPGHDSKLLSQIAQDLRDKKINLAQAMERLSALPKLKAKLAGRLAAALKKNN